MLLLNKKKHKLHLLRKYMINSLLKQGKLYRFLPNNTWAETSYQMQNNLEQKLIHVAI